MPGHLRARRYRRWPVRFATAVAVLMTLVLATPAAGAAPARPGTERPATDAGDDEGPGDRAVLALAAAGGTVVIVLPMAWMYRRYRPPDAQDEVE